MSSMSELNKRSLDIFRELVDAYMETGEPIGSRTISKRLSEPLSPATVRNIMADLEDLGLLYSPHTSAGRIPTPEGLKFFINGLLEVGILSEDEKENIKKHCIASGQSVKEVLEDATKALSGLAKCAGIVMAPKNDSALRHIDFVYLAECRVLVILVFNDGSVENRIIEVPQNVSISILNQATRYINARLAGRNLQQAKSLIELELISHKERLDDLTSKIVEKGIAIWDVENKHSLIVSGRTHLLSSIKEIEELDKIKQLFTILETQEAIENLLDAAIHGAGIQIFIGSENDLFHLSGCSLIVSPYTNDENKIIGAIGVIGPSRMNYGKIIPLVDYTAKVVGKILFKK